MELKAAFHGEAHSRKVVSSRPEWRGELGGGGGARRWRGGEEKEAGEVAAMVKTISVVLVFVGVYVASNFNVLVLFYDLVYFSVFSFS